MPDLEIACTCTPVGSALRDVEQVGDDLEFGDRLAAEPWLAAAGRQHVLLDLLSVEVQVERLVLPDAGRIRDVVRRDALDEHRQLEPVAALQRHRLHLAAIDVASDLGRREVDQRRFTAHGERFGQGGNLQRKGDRGVLPDQQLHLRDFGRAKAGELRLHLIGARRHQKLVGAALVAQRDVFAARLQVGGGHRRTRENGLRFVADDTVDGGCVDLRSGCHRGGQRRHQREDETSDPHIASWFSLERARERYDTASGERIDGSAEEYYATVREWVS